MPLLTIGELIDRSWDHYRRDFVDLMSVSGWILLAAIFNVVALALYPSASKIIGTAGLTGVESAGVVLYAFSNWIVTPIIGLWVFATLVRLVRAQLSGRRASVREAMMDGKRLFVPLFVVSALVFALMACVVLIGFGPAALLSILAAAANSSVLTIAASASMVIGVIAAIVLGFRWSVHYYFAPFALLVDDVRGKASLTASRKLVEGRFWGVLLRLGVPKIVFILLGALAMALVTFVLSLATSTLTGLNLDVQLRLATISASVLSTIVAVLLNPIIIIADLMLYQSLKR